MKLLIRSSVTLLLAIAALALPAGASAAPASTTFFISGNEYAFTSTVGSFAGTGHGNAGDRAVWNTSVQHDPLGSVPWLGHLLSDAYPLPDSALRPLRDLQRSRRRDGELHHPPLRSAPVQRGVSQTRNDLRRPHTIQRSPEHRIRLRVLDDA